MVDMKVKSKYLLVVLISTTFSSRADSFNEIIKNLDRPYAVTENKKFNIRCVWTKGEHGHLESENFGNEGTGLCWDKKEGDEAEELNKSGKLKWINPQRQRSEFFTDLNNACFYGYMGNQTGDWEKYLADKYAKTSSKYRGQLAPIKKLGEAFDYGKYAATAPGDCLFISKKIMTEN